MNKQTKIERLRKLIINLKAGNVFRSAQERVHFITYNVNGSKLQSAENELARLERED